MAVFVSFGAVCRAWLGTEEMKTQAEQIRELTFFLF